MQYINLNLGDDCWIHLGNHQGKLTKGKVVHMFILDWGSRQHVVQIDTAIEPILEVRDGLAISDHPDKPIGFWRKNVTK